MKIHMRIIWLFFTLYFCYPYSEKRLLEYVETIPKSIPLPTSKMNCLLLIDLAYKVDFPT